MAEVGAILRKQQEKLGELLCKKTHFLPTEIQGLLNVHRRLQMTPKSNDSNAGSFLQRNKKINLSFKVITKRNKENQLIIPFHFQHQQ